MRGGHLLKRARKELVRNLIAGVVVCAPIAAILAFWSGTSLSMILAFGGVVTVLVALVTVLGVWVGGDSETLLGSNHGTRDESGYYPEGTHHSDSLDGGWGDGGGGGGDGGVAGV